MGLIQLDIKGISYSQTQTGAYALVLSEADGERTLPIVIGAFEAQSIAIALESEITPPRPLTHDLFKTFSTAYDIFIKEVVIYKLIDGVFFSNIVCVKDNEERVFDGRTSDAIALAIRFDAPIYTHQHILESAGIILSQDNFAEPNEEETDSLFEEDEESLTEGVDQTTSEATTEGYQGDTIQELEKKLNIAIQKEDYETAAKIRDELDKR
ncbi:MAG: bifunctional nuclease family protein [Wenyingzhuangia sp.]|jgi:uncharacterized protein|uniref:bifunctional nuclease family protein n=1 Tax=Wenyingzhuangia sp. TaxID=1964193 RepID=UPI003219961B